MATRQALTSITEDPRHAYAVGDDDQKGLGEQNFGHMREPCRVRGEEKRGKAYIFTRSWPI